jgi:hypothetical protein
MVFRPRAGRAGIAKELFTQLFGDLLAFVYHCLDRIVIYGYLSGLSRPEQVVHFFRNVVGVPALSKEVLSQRTADYQAWVEAFARNHRLPIEWAEKGVRKSWLTAPKKVLDVGVKYPVHLPYFDRRRKCIQRIVRSSSRPKPV